MASIRLLAFAMLTSICATGISGLTLAQHPGGNSKKTTAYTVEYDVRDILESPETMASYPPWNGFRDNARLWNLNLQQKAAMLVRALAKYGYIPHGESTSFDLATIQVVNSTRLIIRADAEKHTEIASLLAALRRLSDLWVTVKTQLYEVDDAFRTKLKDAKPVDWEEEQRRLLNGERPPSGALFNLLDKQTPIQTGDEVKVDDGFTATLLSRHHVRTFLPNRAQTVKGDKSRQVVLEGVAFTAGIRISPDRRFVRLRFTEKATEVERVKREKVMVTNDGKEVEAEIPLLKEDVHTRDIEILDGGSILLPVHYRPKALEEKNRWWVLNVTPRLVIPEEEEQIVIGALDGLLPPLAHIAPCSFFPDSAPRAMSVVAGRAWRTALTDSKRK